MPAIAIIGKQNVRIDSQILCPTQHRFAAHAEMPIAAIFPNRLITDDAAPSRFIIHARKMNFVFFNLIFLFLQISNLVVKFISGILIFGDLLIKIICNIRICISV